MLAAVGSGSTSEDEVVLVNSRDDPLGTLGKTPAHASPGSMHRAVSVALWEPTRREVLLQRRAATKYHFGDRWSNSSCTHPRVDESCDDAARRSARIELGVRLDACEKVGTLRYRAFDRSSGLAEHEYDHVFVASTSDELDLRPQEVSEVRWWDPAQLVRASTNLCDFTPWMLPVLALVFSAVGLVEVAATASAMAVDHPELITAHADHAISGAPDIFG